LQPLVNVAIEISTTALCSSTSRTIAQGKGTHR
jgi:hypothetical protein